MGSCGCESWDRCCHKPTSRSQRFLSVHLAQLFSLPICLSRYQYCYGVEPHKRKQPCTEPADPKHAYTLGSKNVKMEKNCWDKFPLTESNVKVSIFCRRRTNRANE
ncbi:hypothetical protein Tsp_05274 [Trichinella spiralis]|uniref:hypothetical protein n=1 Tax=Trichinella spiralis TaxID=6334 RepID=UPI0001EFEC81|nr:hypothetical protein Tsp_05274 [Trichinella spiralis]